MTKPGCQEGPNDGHSLTSEREPDGHQMGDEDASAGRQRHDEHSLKYGGEPRDHKASSMTMSRRWNGTENHCHISGAVAGRRPMGDEKMSEGLDDPLEKLGIAFASRASVCVKKERSSHDCWDPGGTRLLACPPSA